jgi:hypothetical protein
VSTNAGQLAKLGTDNLVLVSSTDLDARYVNVTGDTMTGNLIVSAAGNRLVTVSSTDGGSATVNLNSSSNAGQVAMAGAVLYATNYASGGTIAVTQSGAGSIRLTIDSVNVLEAKKTGLGVGWLTPTVPLEVGGATKLRSTLEVVGNITSAGTAHSFAANSITASAIAGLPAASSVAGAALTATGAVGVSTAYARADHSHPLPALKADDLTDVTVAAPSTGQVLRYNGTAFVNAQLSYADLSGSPATSPVRLYTVGKILEASDIGCSIVNVSTVNAAVIQFTLPADAVMPVGSRVEIFDASSQSTTHIGVAAGVSMFWNSTLTNGGGAGTVSGGAGPRTLPMANPLSRIVAIKVSANTWMLFD